MVPGIEVVTGFPAKWRPKSAFTPLRGITITPHRG
jgi:hypothetical protein